MFDDVSFSLMGYLFMFLLDCFHDSSCLFMFLNMKMYVPPQMKGVTLAFAFNFFSCLRICVCDLRLWELNFCFKSTINRCCDLMTFSWAAQFTTAWAKIRCTIDSRIIKLWRKLYNVGNFFLKFTFISFLRASSRWGILSWSFYTSMQWHRVSWMLH